MRLGQVTAGYFRLGQVRKPLEMIIQVISVYM